MAEKKKPDTEENVQTEEKKVTVRLPLSREETAPLYVAVNDRTFLIKRGVDVEVPECVAEVIRESERAKMVAFEYEESVRDKN